MKYHKNDILIIDDIDLIAKKEQTQEELVSLFNSLNNAGKNIVIAGILKPEDLNGLDSRLISRVSWGKIVEIKPHWE